MINTENQIKIEDLNNVKEKIRVLFNKSPRVHMNISLVKPKLHLNNVEATIKGVFPFIFQIEECSNGHSRTHSLQYTDVLMKRVEILELDR